VETESEFTSDVLYRRLQVAPLASRGEIVSAYRRLAHAAHPDAHPDDPEAGRRFREITEAYEVLSDPERRASYDRARRHARRPSGASRDPRPESRREAPPVRAIPDNPYLLAVDEVRDGPVLRTGPVRFRPAQQNPPAGSPHRAFGLEELENLFLEIVRSWWWF
jgi:curved DNA-binding protein CbpA